MAKTRTQPKAVSKVVARKPAAKVDPEDQNTAMRSLFASRVKAGLMQLEDLPDSGQVQELARVLKRKVMCTYCCEKRSLTDLTFRQWCETEWVAYCYCVNE